MTARPLAAAVALAMVGVSALGLKLSEVGSDDELLWGQTGRPVVVNAGEITVSRVRVGTSLITYGNVSDRTDGVFVAVTVVATATGRDKLAFGNAALVSGDVHYDAFSSTDAVRADPGFQTTTQLTFEVDPQQVDGGAALELHPNEIVSGYQERLHIRLADEADVAAWAAEARDRPLEIASPQQRAVP